MVLAAYGVDHEELVSIAEPLLSDLPRVPRPEEPKSKYIGGQYRRVEEGVCLVPASYTQIVPRLLCFSSPISSYSLQKLLS